MIVPEDLKQIQRTMWSLGDYSKVADLLQPGAADLVARLDIRRGHRHLDVATGNGNVALLSGRAGADVIGLDLTDAYFPEARDRARRAGLAIDFIEADAEALPFPDASFDVVTSTYGVQFAPRHERSAGEMVRVCKAGGVIGLCNWTPRSWTAHFQDILASYFPPPPSYTAPAMMWGDEDYMRALLGPGFRMETRRMTLVYPFPSAEQMIAFFESSFGPCLAARRTISPRSRWTELRSELVEMTERFHQTDERGSRVEVEYLRVVARKTVLQ